MKSIGIRFPFTETYDGGIIGYTKIETERIKSNLLSFLTLKKGQRPMNNMLYSPIYDYIMEQWDEISESSLTDDLKQKIVLFFEEIELKEVKYLFEEERNLLHVTLYYYIIDLKIYDDITISVLIQD